MERYRITFYYTDDSPVHIREYEGVTRISAKGIRRYKGRETWYPEKALVSYLDDKQRIDNRNAGKVVCIGWDIDIWEDDNDDFRQLLHRMIPVHPREVMTHG